MFFGNNPRFLNVQATERFQAVYPMVRELALAGSQNSKTTRPVAQQLLSLSIAAVSEGGHCASSYVIVFSSPFSSIADKS